MKNSLASAFMYNTEENIVEANNVNDYEVFKDKDLLDSLRTKVVESIIDENIPEDENIKDYIDKEINRVSEGIDLSTLERSHLYNLIENEIYGYGPITELLEDENITEIMVNSPKEIYIEIDGNLVKDDSKLKEGKYPKNDYEVIVKYENFVNWGRLFILSPG